MSAQIKDGGSAFPVTFIDGPTGQPCAIAGMTLRDYFAAKCVAAMVSTIHISEDYDRYRDVAHSFGLKSVSDWFALEAYKQADAMLRAREVQP
jgi:hypothetical protein